MKDNFTISVIIPVYNGEKYLAEAIQSVLVQTYRTSQIIVVDDGSTDAAPQVVRQFGDAVEYYYQPHRGAAAARNRGVAAARGNFFAFLDADDLWTPDKLSLQIAAFDADPRLDAVFGHVEQFVSPEIHARFHLTPALPAFLPGTMLVRRESFWRVGLFETAWAVAETVDWHARLLEKKLYITMIPRVLYRRRLHDTNQGILKREARLDYVRAMKAALDRRRGREKSS